MFFIRRYVKGNHQSGTKNVFEWDERPSIMDFIYTCEAVGEGKYVLFERGVGIRGMRKINEYTVKLPENLVSGSDDTPLHNGNTVHSHEPSIAEMVVFAAEEMGVDSDTILAVKKNMKMSDLSDDELVGMLEQVSDTEVASAEGFGKYQGDLKALLKEFKKRATDMTLTKEAPKSSSNSKLNMVSMFAAGGIVGSLATAGIYKKKITDMEERFGALEASMAETEKTVKKQAKEMEKKEKAAEAVRQFDSRMGMDATFLNTFNNNNGPEF